MTFIVGGNGSGKTTLAKLLVAACLEERPFLVFDEWAANQDPAFKCAA